MASRSIRLAVVPGDGIGPEVVAEGLKVLDALGLTIEQTAYELGATYWHKTGEALPDAVLEEIRGHDAILLGAVGDPSVPSGVLERGLLLRLRFELDHYINLRPGPALPRRRPPRWPASGPRTSTCIVVREGTEGPYAGAGGVLRRGTPQEIATQESVNTAFGVERTVRYAFELAARPPAQEAHPRPQEQRPGLCRRPVVAYGRCRGQGVPRASTSTTAMSTPPPCSSSASHSAST